MTDRLAEFHQGAAPSAYAGDDIEAGVVDAEADAILSKFNREADAIDKVYAWSEKAIRTIESSLSDPNALPSIGQQLDTVETKLDAVRKRLKRMAGESKELAATKGYAPSTLRIRITRYTKLGKDFMTVTSKMETVRQSHRNAVASGVKQDILVVNPHANERQVDRALAGEADLQDVLQVDDMTMRHQVQDLQQRNDAIQKLSKNIVELHQMFTDMSILVDGQQELINDIEYNVKEVKQDTRKAGDELVEARKHQKSARKKKACICFLVIAIVIGVAAAIIIPIALKNGWFSGGNGDGNNSNDSNNDSNSSGSGNGSNGGDGTGTGTGNGDSAGGSSSSESPTNPTRRMAPIGIGGGDMVLFKSKWFK